MRYLVYGLSSILTSNAAASAVVHYAAALGQSNLTDVVTVPVIGLIGAPTTVTLVLGPGIPVLIEDAPDDPLESADTPFVTDIETRTRAVLTGTQGRR